jgi:SNF2 family DNA or RNA helicase
MIMERLMPHQHKGVDFLLRSKCGLLAFEQGLGKTLVAVAAFDGLRHDGIVDRLVVVCPNSLKKNWCDEIARFAADMSVEIIGGSLRRRKSLLANSAANVLIINYESARNEIAAISAVLRRARCVLVLDESHSVKSLTSLNNIAARCFAPLAEYRWLLSGTPITNKPTDIHSQIEVIDLSHPLGSRQLFEIEFADAERNPACRRNLNQRLKKYVLRRTKKECLALPQKSFVDIQVELPRWQRQLYDQIREGLVNEIRGMTADEYKRFARINALTKLLRLSQVASNPALVFEGETRLPGKFSELDRILGSIPKDEKVILWSSYVQTIKTLAKRYESEGVVSLFGEVPATDRQAIVERFQADPKVRLLVANPAAAGSGFTLTAATYAIYETLNWRYDLYAQSQDRNHRIGQARDVQYIRLVAKNTVEEAIMDALARKDRMAQEIVSGAFSSESIATMSREEFCRVFLSENGFASSDNVSCYLEPPLNSQ